MYSYITSNKLTWSFILPFPVHVSLIQTCRCPSTNAGFYLWLDVRHIVSTHSVSFSSADSEQLKWVTEIITSSCPLENQINSSSSLNPQKMTIDLYYMPLSAPCRSIIMLAKVLGIELNLIKTDLFAGDHMKPEFLKVSWMGVELVW